MSERRTRYPRNARRLAAAGVMLVLLCGCTEQGPKASTTRKSPQTQTAQNGQNPPATQQEEAPAEADCADQCDYIRIAEAAIQGEVALPDEPDVMAVLHVDYVHGSTWFIFFGDHKAPETPKDLPLNIPNFLRENVLSPRDLAKDYVALVKIDQDTGQVVEVLTEQGDLPEKFGGRQAR